MFESFDFWPDTYILHDSSEYLGRYPGAFNRVTQYVSSVFPDRSVVNFANFPEFDDHYESKEGYIDILKFGL